MTSFLQSLDRVAIQEVEKQTRGVRTLLGWIQNLAAPPDVRGDIDVSNWTL
jgi:hypothetical protein